jgi:hypothetical protein
VAKGLEMLGLFQRKDVGLVVDWNRYQSNGFVSAMTPFLIEAILKVFRPTIISTQTDYNQHKKKLKKIVSIEWGIPTIQYDTDLDCVKALAHSDPHYEPEKWEQYFTENQFDYVLSFYKAPFFYHNPKFDQAKFVHFSWAVPDAMIYPGPIKYRSDEIAIFGGKLSDAYDVRNWCRHQPGVTNYEYSGVENKKLDNKKYYHWLRQFDAVVAAGSSNPIYDLVTPKYFEIMAAGALLIGQSCQDFESLGFVDGENCLAFTKTDFLDRITCYRRSPSQYIEIREKGRDLILHQHKISDRIKLLKELLCD